MHTPQANLLLLTAEFDGGNLMPKYVNCRYEAVQDTAEVPMGQGDMDILQGIVHDNAEIHYQDHHQRFQQQHQFQGNMVSPCPLLSSTRSPTPQFCSLFSVASPLACHPSSQ
jgi:hypothetical protein